MVDVSDIITQMREQMTKIPRDAGTDFLETEDYKKWVKENQILFSKFTTRISKASNTPKKCFYPDCQEPDSNIILAHSIQRAKMEEIADKGFVIRFEPDMNKGLIPKGIGSASTFKGFCGTHDKIFSKIEDEPYSKNDEQNFLYFYRTICKYYYDELSAYNEADIYASLNLGETFFDEYRKEKNTTKSNFAKLKEKADEIVKSSDYSKVKTDILKLDFKSQIFNSTIIWAHTDFKGHELNNKDFKIFTLNIFPQEDKTFALFTYLDEDSELYSYIKTQLIEQDIEEQKRLLNLLITYEPRNMAYNMDLFSKWSEEDNENFMTLATDDFHLNKNHFKEEITFNFFNEGEDN